MYPTTYPRSRIIQINYDLMAPGQNYEAVKKYVESYGYGNWVKALASLWFIKTTKTPAQVRDEIALVVDRNDKVLVMDTTGDDWATRHLPVTAEWLNRNDRVAA